MELKMVGLYQPPHFRTLDVKVSIYVNTYVHLISSKPTKTQKITKLSSGFPSYVCAHPHSSTHHNTTQHHKGPGMVGSFIVGNVCFFVVGSVGFGVLL